MIDTKGFNFQNGEWNDSLNGDFIWGNANIGEALSSVVTPYTWSAISYVYNQMNVLPGYSVVGNIGGRPYSNGTVMVSVLKAIGKDVDAMFRELGGSEDVPEDLTIPVISISWRDKISILYNGLRIQIRERNALRRIPQFLAENPGWCSEIRRRVRSIKSIHELIELYHEINAHSIMAFWPVVSTVWQYSEAVAPLRRELITLIGESDTNTLLSGVSSETNLLASLGPVVGLSRVERGEMSRQEYLELYGHRGPYEAEFAAPRPAEDPAWLERLLDTQSKSAANLDEMLGRQRSESQAAWERFRREFPERAGPIKNRLEMTAEISRTREAVRSELTRQVWAGRDWVLRVGEYTGLGEDIFFLITEEVLHLLEGKPALTDTIPARKETYNRYRALPPYPPIISGQFDPFAWAADPHHRNDIFDSHTASYRKEVPSVSGVTIKGLPGSSGRAEGKVRRLDAPEDGYRLQPGEILVTSQTNIGWTLLFPRAAAVVTDVGAPLSHAAVVARELGIPAVVGCGNATALLKTGDQVRVDGGKGIIEIIRKDQNV